MTDTRHSSSYCLCTYNAVYHHQHAQNRTHIGEGAPPHRGKECRGARQHHPADDGGLALVLTSLQVSARASMSSGTPLGTLRVQCGTQPFSAASLHTAANASTAGWERVQPHRGHIGRVCAQRDKHRRLRQWRTGCRGRLARGRSEMGRGAMPSLRVITSAARATEPGGGTPWVMVDMMT